MNKPVAALAAAALALGLSSCGNDDDKAATAVSDSIMKSQKAQTGTSRFLTLKRKEADCVGQGMVDKIGVDRLQKYKVLDKDLNVRKQVTDVTMSADDAESATGVLFGCTDVPAMMKKAVNGSSQVPPSMKACVTRTLDDPTLRSVFTKVFNGKRTEAQQELVKPMMKCGLGG